LDANNLLTQFRDEVSKSEYEDYISLLDFSEKGSKADALVFTAPNELMAKFLQSKYAGRLAYFYEVQSGNKASVHIQSIAQKPIKSRTKIDIAQIKAQSTILNPSYTFENFVVGDSNNYAFTTCKAVSSKDKLGRLYNPIFIYGASGLGKTHLLQAIGNACLELGKR
jgi:chromosomal replication initiator protein